MKKFVLFLSLILFACNVVLAADIVVPTQDNTPTTQILINTEAPVTNVPPKIVNKKRTIIDFSYPSNVFDVSGTWAANNDFRVIKSTELNTVLYKRGHYMVTAPIMCKITQNGQDVHIEAYVKVDPVTRTLSLFLLPSEMGLQSGGFRGVVPRLIGRQSVNDLLYTLKQAPIK